MAESVRFLSSRFLSASTLVGANVRNAQDESLGDLKDCMIDTTTGKIAYGVLSFGGVLGIGHKLFAIPWDVFRVDAARERLILDVSRDRLKDAPGFDENHWPDFSAPDFDQQLRTHYTYTTAPARDAGTARPQ